MSELALQLIEENKRTKNTSLDLGKCGLKEIPDELFECVWLEELVLSNEWWGENDWVSSANEGEDNHFSSIPTGVGRLQNLRTLRLNGVPLHKWEIQNLEALTDLSTLQILDLSFNPILDIVHLQKLVNLKTLFLNETEISDVSPLQDMTRLQFLSLWENKISDISSLQGLKNLRTLCLRDNKISDITHLKELIDLKFLVLNANQISDISPLQNLSRLRFLYLRDNRISNILPLQRLKGLKNLNLSSNQIVELPLTFLETIPLELNLQDDYEDGGKIYLSENHIQNVPPEVLEQGREFVIKYLKGENKVSLNECKVIITGRGEAGKTSLQKRLFGKEKFNRIESQTHGIRKRCWEGDVKDADGKLIKVNFWDMGGQKDQQSLHELFYTDNTLYILLLDRRKDEKPEDFLELIKVYAKNSPVIIVINNKVDLDKNEKPEYDLTPVFDSTLRNKYPNIKEVFGVCCGHAIDPGTIRLRKYLQQIIPTFDFVSTEYPIEWIIIKNKLVEGVKENYLTMDSYQQLCTINLVEDNSTQVGLVKMLHNTGTITFFDVSFLSRYILNPDWVTTGAYEIMLSPLTSQNKGLITEADIRQIFKTKMTFKYTVEDYAFIMGLMKAFNLCHEKSDKSWLIPSSLGGISKTDLVAFRKEVYWLYKLKYNVHLPDSIIHRFIARNIDNAVDHDYWKNGIVVRYEADHTTMFVEADSSEKEIRLWIKGENIRDCWEAYRKDFREFSKGFQYSENVVLDNEKNIMVCYADLMDLYRNGESKWFKPQYGKIDVQETLGMFEKQPTIMENEKGNINPTTITISPIITVISEVKPVFNNTVNLSATTEFTELQKTITGLEKYINEYHTQDIEWKNVVSEVVKDIADMEDSKTKEEQVKAFQKTENTFEKLKKVKDWAAIVALPTVPFDLASKVNKIPHQWESLMKLLH